MPNAMQDIVPEGSRVVLKEVLFDLRERFATCRCGTRGLAEGILDERTGETELKW